MRVKIASTKAKVAKVAPVVARMAKHEPKAAALQTKLEAFMRGPRAERM